MAKRKTTQTLDTWQVEQEVIRTGVQGESFDLLLEFKSETGINPTLYVDEDTAFILKGLVEQYGRIIVKVNWWSPGLKVIAPDDVPNASVALPEAPQATESENPSRTMDG